MYTAALILALFLGTPDSERWVVTPMDAGPEVSKTLANTLTEAVAAELRRQSGVEVMSHAELQAVVQHDALTMLLGCDDAKCQADLAGAVKANAIVSGSLGKVGQSWVVYLKAFVVATSQLVSVDRRLRSGNLDDVLDVVKPLVGELVETVARKERSGPASGQATVTHVATAPAGDGNAIPAAFRDIPLQDQAMKKRLELVRGADGLLVAYDPEGGTRGPLFAGSAQGLYQQRIIGAGRNGSESFNFSFWEPRVTERWRASFDMKKGQFELRCDETVLPLTPVAKKEAQKILNDAPIYGVRWQRKAVWLARDNTGMYYYVDQALEPRNNEDYRLFVGYKGKVAHVPLNDSIVDGSGSIFLTTEGRFIVRPQDKEAAWGTGRAESPLVYMDIYSNAAMVYRQLGAYQGQALGTPCDRVFAGR